MSVQIQSWSKRLLVTLTAALCVGALALNGCAGNAQREPVSPTYKEDLANLVIIHTNDVHGYLQADEDTVGLATVAQMKTDYEAQGRTVLLLDAGDVLQGTSLVNETQGAMVPQLMNLARYDAMAIGNHEFDYGADKLQERLPDFTFPVLSANITVDATGELLAQPNTVITLPGGTKVGIFGLTTPETKTKSAPKNTAGITIAQGNELYKIAQAQIDELREQDCDLVICLGHLGENDVTAPNRAADVVAHTSGIDLLIDGHDHREEYQAVKDKSGRDVIVVETGSYLDKVGVLTNVDDTWAEELVGAGGYEGSDATIAEAIAAEAAHVDELLNQVVGSTSFVLDGSRFPGNRDRETNFGDFASDALLWQATNTAEKAPDAAIINGGGIRASIDAGDITLHEIHDAMPFGNQLVTIVVTGAQLLEALEAATQGLPEAMGSFPQVAGITYTVDASVAYEKGEQYPDSTYFAPAKPGSRITITDVNGKGFDEKATYIIATSDFIASGGDTYYCFAEAAATSIQSIGYVDYQSLQNYLVTECGGTVPERYAAPQGRITITLP